MIPLLYTTADDALGKLWASSHSFSIPYTYISASRIFKIKVNKSRKQDTEKEKSTKSKQTCLNLLKITNLMNLRVGVIKGAIDSETFYGYHY